VTPSRAQAASDGSRPPFRLAYIVSHPIQYQAPLLRRLASEPGLRMKTFFLTDAGARPFHDAGFGRRIEWDVPLLDGYDHEFVSRDRALPLGFNEPSGYSWRRTFASQPFDGVWLHGYAHGPLLRAFAAAKARGMRVLVRGESHDGLRETTRPWRLTAQRTLFRAVDAFLAIGSANREYYVRRGVDTGRIHLTPYSVDNDALRRRIADARQGREALRRELQLSPTLPIVLFASKLQPRKRCADLVDACAALRQDTPAQLLIVGDGDERAALEARARSSGLSRICFAGFRNQSELPALYDLCDIFVLPSEREPWGLVVNEAMNAGKPVVASDGVGAVRDLVRDGESGCVYPVGNVARLTASLQQLLDDPPLRARMGQCGRDLVGAWGLDATINGVRAAVAALSVNANRPVHALASS
jgi:glycosyltransferase involved in cell wall biosynthesis